MRLSSSPVPHAGRVELRFKGIWGTIFQDNLWDWPFSRTSTLSPGAVRVICRQLGFADGILSAGFSLYGPGVGPMWFDADHLDRCLGHERNILNCSYRSPRFTSSYDHQQDVSVFCKPNTSHTNGKWEKLVHQSISKLVSIASCPAELSVIPLTDVNRDLIADNTTT